MNWESLDADPIVITTQAVSGRSDRLAFHLRQSPWSFCLAITQNPTTVTWTRIYSGVCLWNGVITMIGPFWYTATTRERSIGCQVVHNLSRESFCLETFYRVSSLNFSQENTMSSNVAYLMNTWFMIPCSNLLWFEWSWRSRWYLSVLGRGLSRIACSPSRRCLETWIPSRHLWLYLSIWCFGNQNKSWPCFREDWWSRSELRCQWLRDFECNIVNCATCSPT